MKTLTASLAAGLMVVAAVAVLNSRRGEHGGAAVNTPLNRSDRASIALPPVTALGCDDFPGMSVEQEAAVPLPVAEHPRQAVVSWHCVDSAGLRHPSLVMVAEPDPATTSPQPISTLVRLRDRLHVKDMQVHGTTISLTVAYWGDDPNAFVAGWRGPGGLATLLFRSVDGRHFTADRPRAVAAACGAHGLGAEVAPGPDGGGASWLIRFTNKTKSPCALEGYPSVRPQDGLALVSRSWQTMYGPRGGVRSSVPPILLLRPGMTATSLLEPYDRGGVGIAGLCTADNLAIDTPTGEPVRVFPVKLGWCNPQVHPFVAGLTGSAL